METVSKNQKDMDYCICSFILIKCNTDTCCRIEIRNPLSFTYVQCIQRYKKQVIHENKNEQKHKLDVS